MTTKISNHRLREALFRKTDDGWQRLDTQCKKWKTLHVDKSTVPHVWAWKS